MNLTTFLTWLFASGGCIIAASWVLGQFKGYVALADNVKNWIFFAVAAVFGGGGYALITYLPASVVNAVEPYFLIVAGVFAYVFINKAYTKLVNLVEELKK
jgi:drug/metabolite transporter (DMT)-like permease